MLSTLTVDNKLRQTHDHESKSLKQVKIVQRTNNGEKQTLQMSRRGEGRTVRQLEIEM